MSEDVRWVWIELCDDPWAPDDTWLLHPKVRRYCPDCGQVVHVLQPEGEATVPFHLVAFQDGKYMTSCEASKTRRILEPAP